MLRKTEELNPPDDPALQLPVSWDGHLIQGQVTHQPQAPRQYIRPSAARDAIINDNFLS